MSKIHDHLLALTQLEYKLNAMELELYARYDHAGIFKKQAQRHLSMNINTETKERVEHPQESTGANEKKKRPEIEAPQDNPIPSVGIETKSTNIDDQPLFDEKVGPAVPIAGPASRRRRAPRKRTAKESKANESKAKESKAKESKANESKANESKANESKAKESKALTTDGFIPNRADNIKLKHADQHKTESSAEESASPILSPSPSNPKEYTAQKAIPKPPRELLRSGLKKEHKQVKSNHLYRHEVIRNKKPEPIPVPSEEELFGFFEDSDTLLLDNLSDLLSELPIEEIDQPNPLELGSELESLTADIKNEDKSDGSLDQGQAKTEVKKPEAIQDIRKEVQRGIETTPETETEAMTMTEALTDTTPVAEPVAEPERVGSTRTLEEDQDRLLSDEVMLEILSPPPEPILHESIEALSEALDKDQQNPNLWLARAKLWKKKGDLAAGISDAYRAAVLLPESIETQSLLDDLLLKAKLPQYGDLLKRSK